MPDIKYVCMSDMHLGADNSVLTAMAGNEVDPFHPSDVLRKLVECLGKLIRANETRTRPTLILHGDIFEFALSSDNLSAAVFQRFMELAMPPDKEERLFADAIIYIPGNHDHHLWETAREVQYARFISDPAQVIEAPWHTTKMLWPDGVPSLFANAVLDRCVGLKDVRVFTVYPNLGLFADYGCKFAIFSHGHFTENIYTLMTTLGGAMFPAGDAAASWDWELENFAWIDFFWSAMGRAGPVGRDVGLAYEMMQDPRKFGTVLGEAAHNLLKQYGGSFGRHFGWLLAALVRSMTTSKLERNAPDAELSDGGKGLSLYLEKPLQKQLRVELKELGNVPVPDDITFVFGHTHKPFQKNMSFDLFGEHKIHIYNSGGWVVDRITPGPLYGGAVVLLDERLDSVSLRMYNEAPKHSDYKVSAQTADPSLVSEFSRKIIASINCDQDPWKAFSDTIATTVADHMKRLKATIGQSRVSRSAHKLSF
jgi:hypothetical protein